KAIDVIDEASARVRLKNMAQPPDLKHIELEMGKLDKDKDESVAVQDFERAARLRDKADKLKKKKESIERNWKERCAEVAAIVDDDVLPG
ncbi:MAG: UvrB/UvrC motif-containing protein, partial [Candidatus Brocadiales bacterium]|nr:UvrB/UvrC motif-containing protein [Candidatus Bathyanammoxibius sp.]